MLFRSDMAWATAQTDCIGWIVNPGSNIRITTYDSFYISGSVDLTTATTGNFSFYIVTTARGAPTNEQQPVEQIYNDLIQTPKSYFLYQAKKSRAAIYITVVDRDGNPVPDAQVYLNRTADWSAWNDTTTTNENGICAFSGKIQGFYNLTVNITALSQNFTVNTTNNIDFPLVKIGRASCRERV